MQPQYCTSKHQSIFERVYFLDPCALFQAPRQTTFIPAPHGEVELQSSAETEGKINNLVKEVLTKLPIPFRHQLVFPQPRKKPAGDRSQWEGGALRPTLCPKCRPFGFSCLTGLALTIAVFSFNHFPPFLLHPLSKVEFSEWIQYMDECQGNKRQPVKVLGWKSDTVHVPTYFCDRMKCMSHYSCPCLFLIHLCSVVAEGWDHNWNSFRALFSPPCWVLQHSDFIQDFISSCLFS